MVRSSSVSPAAAAAATAVATAAATAAEVDDAANTAAQRAASPSPSSPSLSSPTPTTSAGPTTPAAADAPSASRASPWSRVLPGRSQFAYVAAGLGGGVFSTLALHPFDTIKTRLQVADGTAANRAYAYRSVFSALLSIQRREGILRGLYKGALPAVIGSSLSWAVYFESYQRVKALLAGKGVRGGGGGGEGGGSALAQSKTANHLLSGTLAGVLTVLVSNPVWLLKTRMQLQIGSDALAPAAPSSGATAATASSSSSSYYSNFRAAVASTWREEGVRGFYRGLGPSLLLVSHGAAQFAAYERMRAALLARGAAAAATADDGRANGRVPLGPQHDLQRRVLNIWENLFAATASKVFASVVTYPLQVARTRMQRRGADRSQYGTFARALRTIAAVEGVRGLYRGLMANLYRVTPSSAIMFVCYEQISSRLLSLR